MRYYAHVRDAIYTALSKEPLTITQLATRIGYSYGYVCQHLCYIRRDTLLNWTVKFIGHGNFHKPLFLIERGKMADAIQEEHLKDGHDSWVRTAEGKCFAIMKHADLSAEATLSPAAKDLYAKAKLYAEMAQETLEKAKSA